VVPGVAAAEVVETLRGVAAAQARYGPAAAGRYVISFTADPCQNLKILMK
jgi:phosphoenolpyruvate carboxylase